MSQDIAHPENPALITEADVYEATRQFIRAYALPALPLEHIIQGWQNRASLPPGTNDYAVMSILYDTQHGTTVETFDAPSPNKEDPGVLSVVGLVELAVQIDVCADSDVARQRARRLAIVTRSSIGVQHFNDWGMSALYADDARDISFVGDARQFVRRWMTTLHLSINEGVTVELPYFDTAKMQRVEDVLVHHKE